MRIPRHATAHAHLFARIHPKPCVSYEHMFPNARRSRIADLTCAALSLTRSFLLLEDDDCVDWEVDSDELEGMQEGHPHREPLRGRPSYARREGQPPSHAQVCLCPIGRSGRMEPGVAARAGADTGKSLARSIR